MSSTGALTTRSSLLCQLWGDSLPASEIAARLGCGRGAVMGKIARLRQERDPEIIAADARRGPRLSRADQVAEWMAEHGGSVMECSNALGVKLETIRSAWLRICHRMGEQAA